MNTEMETELACMRLLNQFTTLNDAGRYEELVELFAEDGQFARPTAPDSFVTGRAAILESFESRRSDRVSRHLLTNILISQTGDNTACGTAYARLVTALPGNRADMGLKANPVELVGDYRVDFRRTAEGWKIARLTGEIILTV